MGVETECDILLMQEIVGACLSKHYPFFRKKYIFDKKQKKLFSTESYIHAREFGIITKKIPRCMMKLYVRLRVDRYRKVNLPELSYNAHIIDLGPLMGTRGVQVKIYDFDNKKVFCSAVDDTRAVECAKNEAQVYELYGGGKHVPQLLMRNGPSCYTREFVQGDKAKSLDCLTVRAILSRLTEIYHLENPTETERTVYVKKLCEQLGGYIDDELSNRLASMALLGGHSVLLVRSHGDFAEKNILVSGNEFFLIDWERVTTKSVCYDVCNFFFKRCTSSNNSFGSNPCANVDMKCLLQAVEKEMGLSSTVGCIGHYSLFLLERMVFESWLYENNPKRLSAFLAIWEPHVRNLIWCE